MAQHPSPHVGDGAVRAYLGSMPAAYQFAFDEEAIEAHAGIVHRRGGRAVHIEVWRKLPERIVALCVVADDAVGLLSRICAALVAHDADIVAAQAYSRRRPDGAAEAVDFLWIRRMPSASGLVAPVRTRDVAAMAETLDAIVSGRATFEQGAAATSEPQAARSTRIRFHATDDDRRTVLVIEAVDRPGLLLAITGTLFRVGLQIVASHVATDGELAVDRFELAELDGSPLDGVRQRTVQTALLAALAALRDRGLDAAEAGHGE